MIRKEETWRRMVSDGERMREGQRAAKGNERRGKTRIFWGKGTRVDM